MTTTLSQTESLAVRLRMARYAAGLSQRQLAAMLGVARQRVSEWETGRHQPSATVLLLWEAHCSRYARSIGICDEDDDHRWDMFQLWRQFIDWAINACDMRQLSLSLLQSWLAQEHPRHWHDAEEIWTLCDG